MEDNSEEGVVKYSKLIEQNVEKALEPTLILSQTTMEKLQPEDMVLEGIENNNYPSNSKIEEFGVDLNLNFKGRQKKFGLKTLVGLSLFLLMIVTGLVAGLIIMSMENHNLKHQSQEMAYGWENEKQTVSYMKLQNQNLTKALKSQVQISQDLKIEIQDILMVFETLQQNHSKAKDEIEKINLEYENLKIEKDAIHEYLNYTMNSTKLLLAAEHGDLEKVRLLLNLGVNANGHDSQNKTPLYFAARKGFTEIAKLLVQHGAMVNSKDINQFMPLHQASLMGHLEIVELLLQNGADVNAKTKEQYTPLILAAYYGYSKIAEVLLQNGAIVDAKDEEQNTPLHLAAEKGDIETIEVLLKYGARKQLKNTDVNHVHFKLSNFDGNDISKLIKLLSY